MLIRMKERERGEAGIQSLLSATLELLYRARLGQEEDYEREGGEDQRRKGGKKVR